MGNLPLHTPLQCVAVRQQLIWARIQACACIGCGCLAGQLLWYAQDYRIYSQRLRELPPRQAYAASAPPLPPPHSMPSASLDQSRVTWPSQRPLLRFWGRALHHLTHPPNGVQWSQIQFQEDRLRVTGHSHSPDRVGTWRLPASWQPYWEIREIRAPTPKTDFAFTAQLTYFPEFSSPEKR